MPEPNSNLLNQFDIERGWEELEHFVNSASLPVGTESPASAPLLFPDCSEFTDEQKISLIQDRELLRLVFKGTSGALWLARNRVTNEIEVLKFIPDHSSQNYWFKRELASFPLFSRLSLQSLRLVKTHSSFMPADGAFFCYVMEAADDITSGRVIDPLNYKPSTLEAQLKSRQLPDYVPIDQIKHWARQMAEGLIELHSNNLLHRDIKPSNIIFVNQQAKIADIGLIVQTPVGNYDDLAGTPGYAAPEKEYTIATDIYCFGKTLYEMITGLDRTQFPALSHGFLERAGRSRWLALNSITIKACDRLSQNRYQSAKELLLDIERV